MKVRLAPGLGALLHVGNARMALATWLLARRNGGHVLLRLDDATPGKQRADAGEFATTDLRWLGLNWDETARQAERLERYEAAGDRLRASGRLYPCFESEEELTAKREHRLRRKEAAIYDRAMLRLTPKQREDAEAGGKRPHWRFLLSGVAAEWGDMVLGRQQVKISAISDPVLVRADGTFHTSFTSVVDDLADGITHVIRGEDNLAHTGVQLDLMAALGAAARIAPIRFAHLPLLLNASGGKLVTRAGPLSLRSLRHDGIEPTALAGMLTRLGTPDAPAPAAPADLAPTYDLSRIGKAAPRFDPRALLALNRRALRNLPFEAVQDRLPPAATPAFWLAIRGELDLLREARGWWDVVTGGIVPPVVENEAAFLHDALNCLPPEPWDDQTWPAWTAALRTATGRRGKALLTPLRLALTGEDHGPDLAQLLPLIGRARSAARLKQAAA